MTRARPRHALARLAAPLSVASLLAFVAGCTGDEASEPPAVENDSARSAHSHGGHEGHGTHAAPASLALSTEPGDVTAGEPVRLRGMIHRADGSMVNRFEETHEKLVHLIVVREGLDYFAHLHPEVDDAGNVTTEFTFPAGGRYLVYADHKPAGGPQATARGGIEVAGEAPEAPELTPNVPGRVSGDGLTAEVAVTPGADGTEIAFDLSDESGKGVADLEPYLGALGHLVILSADGTEYVHAHPRESGEGASGPVRFEAHFTGPGLYKGWAQFQRSGRVLTVPFMLRVGPAGQA